MSNSPLAITPPEALKNQGITQAKDNIPEGKEVCVSGSLIFQFFSKELQARFIKGGQHGNTNESARVKSGK